ncbi:MULTISPECIES: hypothetical protein [unclassified Halomonas]|uniref:hypothetical protein n=1 Tax=unclassified Halomonas TaxID=2609666 RepID=UPI0009906843|nr:MULTISPECIES: hypothetical protein [unclassified Halomonas]AQU83244.1 hypothetical protein B2G49_12110 [Halomonas sp. 'Soap Lake \
MAKIVELLKKPAAMKRIGGLLASLVISFVAAWLLQPKFHDNSGAMSTLVTVFSILAGFLIAVIALVADERALVGKSSRHDKFYLVQIKNELIGHRYLFYTYLFILGLAFIVSLKIDWPNCYQKYSELALLTLACHALLRSFFLPGCLSRKYLEILEKNIAQKEAQEQERDKRARNLPDDESNRPD